jgi:hypothetical protein
MRKGKKYTGSGWRNGLEPGRNRFEAWRVANGNRVAMDGTRLRIVPATAGSFFKAPSSKQSKLRKENTSMSTRNGKIARLPFEIREEINHRLMNNEPAKNIVTWLNCDSTVRLCLEQLFEGRPMTEQNISEWRQGGYEEWLAERSCLESICDLSERAARVSLTDINAEHLLMVITASYADLLQKWDKMPEIAFNRRLIVLQNLATTALAMRRSEQRDIKLKLDRDRLEILRQGLREKFLASSPSSKTRSIGGRPIAGHPNHPKAPEMRRPPVPQPEDDGLTDQEWLACPPAYRPNGGGPSPLDLSNPPPISASANAAPPTSQSRSSSNEAQQSE